MYSTTLCMTLMNALELVTPALKMTLYRFSYIKLYLFLSTILSCNLEVLKGLVMVIKQNINNSTQSMM